MHGVTGLGNRVCDGAAVKGHGERRGEARPRCEGGPDQAEVRVFLSRESRLFGCGLFWGTGRFWVWALAAGNSVTAMMAGEWSVQGEAATNDPVVPHATRSTRREEVAALPLSLGIWVSCGILVSG